MQAAEKIKSAFLRALADPHDSQALFEHLSGPVARVPVSDLRELLMRTRYLKLSLYEMLTRTDLTRLGEEIELDSEAQGRALEALEALGRYRALSDGLGAAAALEAYLGEAGLA